MKWWLHSSGCNHSIKVHDKILTPIESKPVHIANILDNLENISIVLHDEEGNESEVNDSPAQESIIFRFI